MPRKNRQWENANLLEMHRRFPDLHEQDSDFLDSTGPTYGPRVDWRSTLSELFQARNMDVIEAFRKCTPSTTQLENVRTCFPNRTFRKDEWEWAERLWHCRVEKRLRVVISTALAENGVLQAYLQGLENVLSYFFETRTSPPKLLINSALTNLVENGHTLRVMSGKLNVPLKNSPFHRLVLHGLCQFYGFHSQVLDFSYLTIVSK